MSKISIQSLQELQQGTRLAPSEPWHLFIKSLRLDYDAWHDGTDFDLDALARMPAVEQNLIREWLRGNLQDRSHQIDWRELEAAAALGETQLLASLAEHPSYRVRLRATRLLGQPGAVETLLCVTLAASSSNDDVSQALDLVESHPIAEVRDALVQRVQKVDSTFINAAMVLLDVFCQADAWAERPLLFRIQSQGPNGPLLRELLARIKQ